MLCGGERTQYRLAAVQKTLKILPPDWYEHALPRRTHNPIISIHCSERDMSPPSEILLNLSECPELQGVRIWSMPPVKSGDPRLVHHFRQPPKGCLPLPIEYFLGFITARSLLATHRRSGMRPGKPTTPIGIPTHFGSGDTVAGVDGLERRAGRRGVPTEV